LHAIHGSDWARIARLVNRTAYRMRDFVRLEKAKVRLKFYLQQQQQQKWAHRTAPHHFVHSKSRAFAMARGAKKKFKS
jgi:hypothetical protein